MNDWERHANAALRTLAEAYESGGIDRQAYRARRRRVLQGLIGREDITQPAPGRVTALAAGDASINDDPITLLLASRKGISWRSWWVPGLMGAAAVLAIAYWILEQGNG